MLYYLYNAKQKEKVRKKGLLSTITWAIPRASLLRRKSSLWWSSLTLATSSVVIPISCSFHPNDGFCQHPTRVVVPTLSLPLFAITARSFSIHLKLFKITRAWAFYIVKINSDSYIFDANLSYLFYINRWNIKTYYNLYTNMYKYTQKIII